MAALLDALFEELLRVGGDPASAAPGRHVAPSEASASPLSLLSDALAAASCARVLVVPADRPPPTVDLLLALTAWPEQAAVVAFADDDGRPLAALYRSEDVLPILRRQLAHDRSELSALHDRIEVDRVTLASLGIETVDQTGLTPDRGASATRSVLPEGR